MIDTRANYIGPEIPAGIKQVFIRAKNSDADTLSNAAVFERELVPLGATLQRDGHWMDGWVESLLVPLGPARERCDALLRRLENDPILDENDYEKRVEEQALWGIGDALHDLWMDWDIPGSPFVSATEEDQALWEKTVAGVYAHLLNVDEGVRYQDYYPDREVLEIALADMGYERVEYAPEEDK